MSIATDLPDHLEAPASGPSADVADSLAGEALAWHALSATFATRGETRGAVLAMWASDLRALHLLLWENGLGTAPDAGQHVRACAEAVQTALRDNAADLRNAASPRVVVENARTALAGVFDPSVHELLAQHFLPVDHLDDIHEPLPGSRSELATDRLAGRTPQRLLVDLRTAAADCVTVAHALGDDLEEVDRQLWHAALAAFETFLIDSSLRFGDTELLAVALRWELAADVLTREAEYAVANAVWLREQLLAVVSPQERPELLAELELAGVWPR